MTRALIIVDVQNDFCPGGSLATDRGAEIAGKIGAYQLSHAADYAAVIATQDWHIDPGEHFSETPDFKDSWPVHCVAESAGAAFHPAIKTALIDETFRKGKFTAAYSGFEGFAASDGRSLAQWLEDHNISGVDIVGIATDHCVRATALDALRAGFQVRILSSMCAAVGIESGDAALEEMHKAGAELV